MKKNILMLLFLLTGINMFPEAPLASVQRTDKKKILIDLKNLPNGIRFFLVQERKDGSGDTVQTVYSKNNKLIFDTVLPEDGKMCFVLVDRMQAKLKEGVSNWIRMLPELESTRVLGDFQSWPKVRIENSKATEVYEEYAREEKRIVTGMDTLYGDKKVDSARFERVKRKLIDFTMQYAMQNINSIATPAIVMHHNTLTLKDKKFLYNAMPDSIKNSYYGIALKKKNDIADRREKVGIGKKLEMFSLEDAGHNKVFLGDVAAKSKYTLVDFWAYWCVPCKQEVPWLKEMYEKYKDKGFNIVSISIDNKYEPWLKTVGELGTKWTNLIDADRVCQDLFLIQAIPSYMLLNNRGEIAAMQIVGFPVSPIAAPRFLQIGKVGLAGKELDMLLSELLGD